MIPNFKRMSSSAQRYAARLDWWTGDDDLDVESMRRAHDRLWLLHNVVAHPLLGIWPRSQYTVDFHQLTSAWLNTGESYKSVNAPRVSNRAWWMIHNVVAHLAIGFLPNKHTFEFHDWTAKKMAVKDWV